MIGRRREVELLAPGDARRLPWKNGRGETLELAIWPPGTSLANDDFVWRVSRAAVVADGAFSTFAGRDRVLVVLDGPGIALDHGDHAPRAELPPLVPYRFAGDWPTRGELRGGPIADGNVIWRRGAVAVDVAVVASEGEHTRPLTGEHALLHVVRGDVAARLDGAAGCTVAVGGSLWVRWPRPGEALHVTLAAGAVCLIVTFA